MITAAEYEVLVTELLDLETRLEQLGQVEIMTSQGPFLLSEQGLWHEVPQQKEYDELKFVIAGKRRIVDAFDMVARYKLALER